jgi:hypothetical protein
MSVSQDRCPACGLSLIVSRFDATFRTRHGAERLSFGIPGGLCLECNQLFVDPDLIDTLDLGDARCLFAIESDVVLQGEASSSSD